MTPTSSAHVRSGVPFSGPVGAGPYSWHSNQTPTSIRSNGSSARNFEQKISTPFSNPGTNGSGLRPLVPNSDFERKVNTPDAETRHGNGLRDLVPKSDSSPGLSIGSTPHMESRAPSKSSLSWGATNDEQPTGPSLRFRMRWARPQDEEQVSSMAVNATAGQPLSVYFCNISGCREILHHPSALVTHCIPSHHGDILYCPKYSCHYAERFGRARTLRGWKHHLAQIHPELYTDEIRIYRPGA